MQQENEHGRYLHHSLAHFSREGVVAISVSSRRSYWIPGSYAPTLSENHNSFLRLLKNKDFKKRV